MSELSGQDLAAIQEVHDRWLSAEVRGDHSQVIDLCTDDVSWIPPNEPPLNGKQAIAQFLTDNAVDLKDIQVSDVVIRGNGSVAYLTSYFQTRFKLPADSSIHESTGAHLWILRKTGNGLWQVAIVTWSYWKPQQGRVSQVDSSGNACFNSSAASIQPLSGDATTKTGDKP
jgi:uncharacterized protein (TIGR02246 family)